MNALRTLRRPLSSAAVSTSRAFSTSPSPLSSAAPIASSSTSSSAPSDPSSHTHYLITLLRSPLHLPAPLAATCNTLGLTHRLTTTLVPITQENAGLVLRIKELVGVRTVAAEDLGKAGTIEWRERPGEGRQGSGLIGREDGGVIRVGTERARGEERGFKVVARA